MKEQGLRADDPEFLKVRNLLAAVQQQSHFAKQREYHAQQLHQRQLLQQTQASSIVNGAHGHPGTDANSFTMAIIVRLTYDCRAPIKCASSRK